MTQSKKRSSKNSSKTKKTSSNISNQELGDWLKKEFKNHFHQSYQKCYYPGWQDLSIYFNHSQKKMVGWGIEEDDNTDIYYIYQGKYNRKIRSEKMVLSSSYQSIDNYIKKKYPQYKPLSNQTNQNILKAILEVKIPDECQY